MFSKSHIAPLCLLMAACFVIGSCDNAVSDSSAGSESERAALEAVVRYIVEPDSTSHFKFDYRLMPQAPAQSEMVPPGTPMHWDIPWSPVVESLAERVPRMRLVDAPTWNGVGTLVVLSRPVIQGEKATVQAGLALYSGTVGYWFYVLERQSDGWAVTSAQLIGVDN